jgi:hypothetical protein
MAHLSRDTSVRKARLYLCLQAALLLGTAAPAAFAGVVQNCGDGGPGSGSLRDAVANADSGDTIDLSQLASKCGMVDSTITLTNGEIVISQKNLKLQGPATGTVTIRPSDGSNSRVLNHTGSELLVLDDLIVTGGSVSAMAGDSPMGGCVLSTGDLLVVRSTISDCSVDGAVAFGGGIYAAGSVALLSSTIKSNHASGNAYGAFGGGVAVYRSLTMIDTSVSGNDAATIGGGVYVSRFGDGLTAVYYSTIDHNDARSCGGAFLGSPISTNISNSTISNNTAAYDCGGLGFGAGGVALRNSTIAFNSVTSGVGGIYVGAAYLKLESTIVARNASLAGLADLDATSGYATVAGSDNVVMTSSGNIQPGVISLTTDPMLGPLQYNGGKTRTHALLRGSPAIGTGNNTGAAWFDQRNRGYPRTSGANQSTDIGAFQFDSIFYGDVDP